MPLHVLLLSAAAVSVALSVNGDGGQQSTVRIMKVAASPIPHVLTCPSASRVQGQLMQGAAAAAVRYAACAADHRPLLESEQFAHAPCAVV